MGTFQHTRMVKIRLAIGPCDCADVDWCADAIALTRIVVVATVLAPIVAVSTMLTRISAV